MLIQHVLIRHLFLKNLPNQHLSSNNYVATFVEATFQSQLHCATFVAVDSDTQQPADDGQSVVVCVLQAVQEGLC